MFAAPLAQRISISLTRDRGKGICKLWISVVCRIYVWYVILHTIWYNIYYWLLYYMSFINAATVNRTCKMTNFHIMNLAGPPARRRMAIEEPEKPELYVITKPIKADPWLAFWELWRSSIAARKVGWMMVHACLEGLESRAAIELESFADNHQHAIHFSCMPLWNMRLMYIKICCQRRGVPTAHHQLCTVCLTQGEMERKERETQIEKAGG